MEINKQLSSGLYLICNREGQINDVLFDDLSIISKDRLPIQFGDVIDKESIKKASEFWKNIIKNEFVIDFEMYVKRESAEPIPMQFSGGCFHDQVWIIEATHNKVLQNMLNEMMFINNEQQNLIRSAEKKLSKMDDSSPESSFDLYDELSGMNNELMNTQRKLTKKNQEILWLNEQLKDKNKELEHFSYSVSHDLKEPLRMVRAFLKRLELKYGDSLDDKAKQYIYYAVDGAKRMESLINNLLEYSRIGRINNQFELTDLNELLNEVKKLNRLQLEEFRGVMNWPEMPKIICQKIPMQQLFTNLISNSLKYRKEDHSPEIFIDFEERQDEWLFSVADNGKGIDSKYYTLIFEIFRKVDDQSTTGTGIGLAICKKIVEEHGGRIWVESVPGKGSTFYFTISKKSESN